LIILGHEGDHVFFLLFFLLVIHPLRCAVLLLGAMVAVTVTVTVLVDVVIACADACVSIDLLVVVKE